MEQTISYSNYARCIIDDVSVVFTLSQSGDVARHLEFVSHNVRSQLDELKRQELDRIRQLVRLKMQQGQRGFGKTGILSPAAHIAAGEHPLPVFLRNR